MEFLQDHDIELFTEKEVGAGDLRIWREDWFNNGRWWLNLCDSTMFASGRGDRRENAICDLRGRTEDGVQEALYCYRKQVSKTKKKKL